MQHAEQCSRLPDSHCKEAGPILIITPSVYQRKQKHSLRYKKI